MTERLLTLTFPGSDGPVEVKAPTGIPTGAPGDANAVLGFGIAILLIVITLLSLGFVVYGGFNWIMSGGDKTKLESARKTVVFAIIGLVIAFTAFFAIQLIGGFFNINLLKVSL